jgi:hypothetical protein
MTQTLAILVEAYRSVNSKRLFWVTLVLSVLVVAAVACVGIDEQGIWLLSYHLWSVLTTRDISRGDFYKSVFAIGGVQYWLAWFASLLALISTGGIFPDLITNGAIGLYVARPIGRLRLFLTQYVAGLLFVTLQVTVFCLASFLVLGLRGHTWEPGVFVAVPLVVCLFSYLFSVCVLLGVLTRSTVAAVLLTILFWCVVWSVGFVERATQVGITYQKHGVFDAMAEASEKKSTGDGQTRAGSTNASAVNQDLETVEKEVPPALLTAHRILFGVKTALPKMSETSELMQRTLVRMADLQDTSQIPDPRMRAAQKELVDELQNRSPYWIVGTSLGFEAVMLALAALVFCRRDF